MTDEQETATNFNMFTTHMATLQPFTGDQILLFIPYSVFSLLIFLTFPRYEGIMSPRADRISSLLVLVCVQVLLHWLELSKQY